MVNIIDNVELSEKEKFWFERLWKSIYNIPIIWTNLFDVKSITRKLIKNVDAITIVATDGLEVYEPIGNEKNLFFNHRILKI